MEARATAKYIRVSPRKMRRSVDMIRGRHVDDARRVLRLSALGPNRLLEKLLRSAVANAEQKGGRVDVDALVVKTLNVDQGPKMRRFMPRAQGRAFRIEKKTSHVYVELATAARG